MYGKVFTQMYDGTLATRGPWQALVTFQQMIVLCDSDGVIDMTPEAIARRTTLPLDIVNIGIAALEQPDAESRTPALEGRRIVRLSDQRTWGWKIVNYAHYRALRSQEDRREYMRTYQRERRDALSTNVNNVNFVNQSSKQKQEAESIKSKTLVAPNGATRPKRAVGSRLPDDWTLPDDWKAWALSMRPDWTPEGIVRESITFRDFWHAKTGAGASKMNWQATWRIWVRRAEKEPQR